MSIIVITFLHGYVIKDIKSDAILILSYNDNIKRNKNQYQYIHNKFAPLSLWRRQRRWLAKKDIKLKILTKNPDS